MAKTVDFKVVERTDAEAFETEVKKLLAEGYELHGNMVVFHGPDGLIHYIQAVVKDLSERRSTGFAIGR
jgi:hypothetical protein